MGTIRISSEDIRALNIFELLTGVTAKDCAIEEDAIGFLIDERNFGKAIGKNGSNVEKVRQRFGKEIFLIQYAEDPTKFIKNIFYPAEVRSVKISETSNGKTAIVDVPKRDYKKAIGDNGRKIKIGKILASRNLGIDNIIVRSGIY
ncbi:MAG: NusA-like transcription termination signal-binding factor [Candidatus Altarchaeaceae archaeon]